MDRHTLLAILLLSFALPAQSLERVWLKAKARTAKERGIIANAGVSIETVASDYVIGIATPEERDKVKKLGRLLESHNLVQPSIKDFPAEDANFRNYQELTEALKVLAAENPDHVRLDSLGQSVEGRELWHLRIGTDLDQLDSKPGIVFIGGHHAREHVSVEMPMKLAEKLLADYKAGDTEVRKLIDNRDIHIIPQVNPDGSEFDIADGDYQMWRKNRQSNSDGNHGVDLNRNYGYGWGGGGASRNPASETYRGTEAFSEPESKAIKAFVEKQSNLTTLLSFHTFSELILYPWGHKYDRIPDDRDYQVHKTMAETMAQWNGYTPEQSSELYIASGDTTDWSYGEFKIISFTFELDPTSLFDGGFYPGQDKIEGIFNKNWKPCLYLMEYADNPYRVIEANHIKYGLTTPLIR